MVAFVAGLAFSAEAGNWPSWRGDVAGSGIVRGEKIPLEWGTKKNVRWRVPLPDRGNSSPIVWGDKVFITQATDSDKRRTVMCFDKRTGELLWQGALRPLVSGFFENPNFQSHFLRPSVAARYSANGSRSMLVQIELLPLTSQNGIQQISSYGIRTKPK